MKFLWIGLGWMVAMQASADPLSAQVLAFFKQREPDYAQTLQVEMLWETPKTLSCSTPSFSLPSNSRRWGTLTLSARCRQQVAILRVSVKVSGKYYRNKQRLQQGSLLTVDNIETRFGRLDKLPVNSWLTPLPLPLLALQTLPAGTILTKNQFRKPWIIKQGQSVPITLVGNGFHIAGRGTALDNAAINQSIRIRLENGQRLTATVNANGELMVK